MGVTLDLSRAPTVSAPTLTNLSGLTRKALAFLKLASIRLMLRKLCNPS